MSETESGQSRPTERRRQPRIAVQFPVRYCFFHSAERPDTKEFRSGTSLDLGPYGIRFEATIADESLLPLALEGDVLIDLIVAPADRSEFKARGRVVWAWAVDEAKGRYMVGVQYVDAQPESRAGFWEHVQKTGKLVK